MLEDRLAQIRTLAATRIPPEARAIMHRHVDDLRASGAVARVAKVGDPAPDFTLPDATGAMVNLASLRATPVVLSFFRGRW